MTRHWMMYVQQLVVKNRRILVGYGPTD